MHKALPLALLLAACSVAPTNESTNTKTVVYDEGRKIIMLWKTKSGQEVHDMDPDYIKLCKD